MWGNGSACAMKSVPGRTETKQLVVMRLQKKQRHHHENCQLQSERGTADIRAQRHMSTMNRSSTIDGQASYSFFSVHRAEVGTCLQRSGAQAQSLCHDMLRKRQTCVFAIFTRRVNRKQISRRIRTGQAICSHAKPRSQPDPDHVRPFAVGLFCAAAQEDAGGDRANNLRFLQQQSVQFRSSMRSSGGATKQSQWPFSAAVRVRHSKHVAKGSMSWQLSGFSLAWK